MKKILVTRKLIRSSEDYASSIFDLDLNKEDKLLTKEELINKSKDCDGILSSLTEKLDADTISNLSKNIKIISTPEGNSNAVGEHAIGMILSLMNKIPKSEKEISKGIWSREPNRGNELMGKTIGLIGYGNTGKSFAKNLSGFNTKVIFFDLKSGLEDKYANSATLEEIQKQADIISLHTSLSKESIGLINHKFISKCDKPFWLINTARGICVNTSHLVKALKEKKVLGAALDVLEFEKSSFEKLSDRSNKDLKYLIKSNEVIITPHIAGWSKESKILLVKVALDKIKKLIS